MLVVMPHIELQLDIRKSLVLLKANLWFGSRKFGSLVADILRSSVVPEKITSVGNTDLSSDASLSHGKTSRCAACARL